MKLSKKLLYSAVVLATVAGPTVSTVAQFATGMSVVRAEDVRQVVTDIPTKTTVNVFKLVSEAYKEDVIKAGGIENKDGAIISKEDLQSKLAAAGAEVKALNNVTFSAYLIKDQKLTDEDAKKVTTKEDADKLVEEGKLELAEEQTTAGDGKATFQLNSQVSENGKKVYARYLFIESAAPRTVSSAIAVPFVMTLPASPESGNGYYSDVNVYPKNIQGNEPKAGKDVKTLGNNILPAQVGENITFFLKGTIPTNIQDYSQYDFTDELDSQLSLTSKTTDFKVSFGENNVLEYTTDYTVDIQNNKVKVALTRAGIDKVAKNTTIAQRRASEALGDKIHDEKNNTADAPFIQVSFNAKLNDTVKLGKAVNNETTITYSNRSDRMLEVKEQIGHVIIPRINQDIPIYAGSAEENLQRGVGHLEGTSLPVGGESTHAVLTAHRGLPTAKLFTNLDKVTVGDRFYIEHIGGKIAYQVDQIKVISPDQLEDLYVIQGEDHITLLTCTPYMINSHRLLVRGKRIPYVKKAVQKEAETFRQKQYLIYAIWVIVGLILLSFLIWFKKTKQKKWRENEKAISQISHNNSK